MALTNQEKTGMRAAVARDGFDSVMDQIRDLAIADKRAAALTALQASGRVTVTDWQAAANYVAQSGNTTLISVVDDITAACAAQDDSVLWPLLVQLVGAVKKHLQR